MSSNIKHDTNIPSSSTSNIHNIQLNESPLNTETEDRLSSNEEEVETQVQTQKRKGNDTNTNRQYNGEQNRCINTG